MLTFTYLVWADLRTSLGMVFVQGVVGGGLALLGLWGVALTGEEKTRLLVKFNKFSLRSRTV
jgi:hypothetical protein